MKPQWRRAAEPPKTNDPVWAWGPEMWSTSFPQPTGPVLTRWHPPMVTVFTQQTIFGRWESATEWDSDGTPSHIGGVIVWMPLEVPEPPS